LLKEIAAMRLSPDMRTALEIGASGDRTYQVDRKAEEVIISGLEALNEPLTVISEEAGVMEIYGGGHRVIVDPIDGSKNAISGIPFYCASIGVADGDTIGDIYLSYIINLISGDEFSAKKGSGAFMNGQRIRSQVDDELNLIAYEAPSPAKDIPMIVPLISRARKARCFGSTALDLAYLACGAVSVFVTPSPSRSFDFAGGWLLVREAGGVFTDTRGDDISAAPLSVKRSTPLLAAGNHSLHRKALGILQQK
jgi:myo-inositol-1(or 4)-monophosphatase